METFRLSWEMAVKRALHAFIKHYTLTVVMFASANGSSCCRCQVTYSVYDYSSVVTFGGYQDDLLLVVSAARSNHRRVEGSENLRFLISRPNVSLQNLFVFQELIYYLHMEFMQLVIFVCVLMRVYEQDNSNHYGSI